MGVNWVDICILCVIAFSAMLAFARGLVREVLGIGSWVGAGFFAVWAFPLVRPEFRRVVTAPDVADAAAVGCAFLVGLLFLSLLSGMVAGAVRASALGGLDRTFGVVFGIVRGAGVLAVAYIVVGLLIPLEKWPEDVQQARTLRYVYDGAALLVSLLPDDYRPVVHIPPGVHVTRAADLLRVAPQGRAVARP